MINRRLKFRLLRLLVVIGLSAAFLPSLRGFPRFYAQTQSEKPPIPLGLPADTWDYYVPRKNPMTPQKIELGRKLFFDSRLSADGRVSCASCHDPKLAFTDGRAVAEGIAGRRGARNSPTLLNAMFNTGQFWDGRADTLEDQAVQPLVNQLEMGNNSYDEVVSRLRAIPEYRAEFQSVFGAEARIGFVGLAVAAYERTLVSGDAAFDRYIAGDQNAISEAARRGFTLFRGKARCSRCHTFSDALPFFTDFNYHNTGVAMNHPNFDKLSRQAYAATDTDKAREVIDALAKQEGG